MGAAFGKFVQPPENAYRDFFSEIAVLHDGNDLKTSINARENWFCNYSDVQNISVYTYVKQNPWSAFDPLGLHEAAIYAINRGQIKYGSSNKGPTPAESAASLWSGSGRGTADLAKIPVYVNPGLWVDRLIGKILGEKGPSEQEKISADIDSYKEKISKSISEITGQKIDKGTETMGEIGSPVPPAALTLKLASLGTKSAKALYTAALKGVQEATVGYKGIVVNGKVTMVPIEAVTSHERIATKLKVLKQKPAAGTPGELTEGAEAFTMVRNPDAPSGFDVTGSGNFNNQASEAAQEAARRHAVKHEEALARQAAEEAARQQ